MANIQLNAPLQKKWYENLLMFLRPVIVLYVGVVIGLITVNGGIFKVEYFIPNQITQGGIILYFLNAGLDYLNKLGKS